MRASACLSIMGSGQSVPKDSPLACVLKNLKPLSLNELKANHLKQLCTQIWPQYQLDNQDRWPQVGTFDLFIYLFIIISWRLITLQYCSGFCHTLRRISHGFTCVFPILIPPPTSLSARSLWVFPVHQVRALVSCIQPGLVICFTIDNIHVSMLFS